MEKTLTDKLTLLTTLEDGLNKITSIKENIDLSYFKEQFNKASTFEEKIKICQLFIEQNNIK